MSDLHPTPTRLALLADVAAGHIVATATGDTTNRRTHTRCTSRIAEVWAAGWVEPAPRSGSPGGPWRLTDTGRAVLAQHGGAS